MQFSPPGGNGTKRVSSDEFPGVAQSVGRQLWELEAARSNRATRTKKVVFLSRNRLFSFHIVYYFIRTKNGSEAP